METSGIRRQFIKVLSLLLLCVLASGTGFAVGSHSDAGNAIIVRQLTVDDGLSQNSVFDIFQDSRGFIWLATENGINRYDGHEFSQLTGQNALLLSLSPVVFSDVGKHISTINEDKHQRLWFGSDDGVSLYDPQSNELTHLTGLSNDRNGLLSKEVNEIIKHTDGTMWLATYNGLHHYSYQKKRFIPHLIPKHLLSERHQADGNQITRLTETPDGMLLLGTQNQGVLLYNPKTQKFSRLFYLAQTPNPAVNEITALYFDNREQLWIGTNQGLIKFDFYHKKVLGNVLDKLHIDGLERQRVHSITQDEHGNIWAAIYGDGILSLNPRDNSFTFYGHQPEVRHGLSSNVVKKLFFDNNGLLWIGSESYGVSIYNPMSKAFSHLTHQPDNNNSLSNNLIWSIEPDPQRNLWIGTNQGLNRVSADKQTITRFLTDNNAKQLLLSEHIHDIEYDNQTNTLWVAGDKGLNHFNPANGDVQSWQHDRNDSDSLPGNFIYDIELDNQRQLWIAGRAGLSRLDLASNTLHHYQTIDKDSHSLGPHDWISSIFIDSGGTVWIGSNNGLNRYNAIKDNFDRFLTSTNNDYQRKNNAIITITEVKRGLIWVGYARGGIFTLDFTADKAPYLEPQINHLGIKDGLPTNSIFGMIPDHVGSVWISTMSGLVQYSLNGSPPRVFAAKEGLLSSEFNGRAYNVGSDGLLYFGSTNGLTVVNPAEIKPPHRSEHLLFSKAVVSQPSGNYTLPLFKQQSVTLDHFASAITISYSDLNYITPKQSHYAYQFEETSEQDSGSWIDVGNDNHVTLHHLTSGKFTFNLRTKTGNGDWGEVRKLTIVVIPPWWRTIYAYIAYIIVSAIAVYLWYTLRKERRAEKRQMHRQIKLFAEAFKNTTEGVMIMHRSRTIVAVNAAFTTITGYTEQEVIGKSTEIISSAKHSSDFYEHIWTTLDEERQWHGEIWQKNKKGIDIAVEMTISSVTNEEQQVSHFVGVFTNITERLNAEQELRKLAKYDALTGLPNRTLLQDRLDHAIYHGRREKQKLALLFLDLDRFKHVNDSLGHDIGDKLLIGVSERINQVLREDDTFARLGGDEFVIILEDFDELTHLTHVANRIIEELGKPFSLAGYEVSTSTSIGITIFPDDGNTSQDLLKNADTAMYHVKEQGRNNFQFYTESMNVKAFERLSVENELRRAIEGQQFVLHYQPRVNTTDGRAASLEALIRWQHPEKGLIGPGYFIDIAEDSGLIVPMSEWVIQETCRQLKTWQNTGIGDISVSVNLSPRLFNHYDLVHFIDETLQFYQVAAGKLELEITEGMLMNDVEATIVDLHRLNELGCHISVDDFGTGYSSLSYLHRFPVHTLKIDRSFVSAIYEHAKGKALVDIIINLAQNLGLELVAEGVETFEQFEFLQKRIPMQIQGYYFSKPIDSEAVVPLLIKGFDITQPVAVTEV